MRAPLALLALVPLAGCDVVGRTGGPSPDELARLQSQIDAVVNPEARAAPFCRVLAYGAKPCGGPSTAVVYSAETTDTTALRRLADRYTEAEHDLNVRESRVSTCEMFVGPTPVWAGGQCVARR